MIRFYRVCVCIDGRYDLVGYYLDPSTASNTALARARSARADREYVIVSQIDVFLNEWITSPLLRVDGLSR